MRRLLAVIVLVLGAVLTLASIFLLLYLTMQSEIIENALTRNLAMLGTLVAGVLLLMGSVYLCTRISVLLFSTNDHPEIPGLRSDDH